MRTHSPSLYSSSLRQPRVSSYRADDQARQRLHACVFEYAKACRTYGMTPERALIGLTQLLRYRLPDLLSNHEVAADAIGWCIEGYYTRK